MSEDYVNGLKSLSSRPDIKNKSVIEFEDENVLDSSNSIKNTKEINNNQSLKEKNENDSIDEASSNESDVNQIDKKNDSSIEDDNDYEEIEKKKIFEKISEDHQNKDHYLNMCEKNSNKNNNILVISLIVLLLCVICASMFHFRWPKISDIGKKFKMDELKNKYPSQSEWFWINIESSFRHSVLKSKDPSIVLLIYDEQTTNTYLNLSQEILSYLSKIDKSTSYVVVSKDQDVDFRGYIEKNMPDESKFFIDTKLSTHFKSGGKLALVEDIHQFPAHSMVLFYAYGDEEKYAKFPGVLIFMSFKLNEKLDAESKQIFSESPKKLREFAENRMFNLWSKWIGEDQLRPLFTRIANNVILVNNE